MKRYLNLIVLILSLFMTIPGNAQQDTLRILGVGNSWTRDSMRWLSAIAKSAGHYVIVGHAYLGGSFLVDQYKGIDDTTYTYRHRNIDQVVHDTYQYWKYVCTVDPVKTPSKGYKNGLAGIGVTFESVVADEPWDIIVFQPHVVVKANLPDYSGFDINDLVRRVKAMMVPEVAAKVRCGLMVPFSYPEGNTDYRQMIVDAYNEGLRPSSQAEWDDLYERMHHHIQSDILALAEHMGDDCRFLINVGKAIYDARHDKKLSKLGYKLQRAQNNTHLAEGVPMYIASLCYAYELLGIEQNEAVFYPPYSKDRHLTGDTGNTIIVEVKTTPSIVARARRCAWNAQKRVTKKSDD